MRNLRALVLWSLGAGGLAFAGACATEVQEPGVSVTSGGFGGATSDTGTGTLDGGSSETATTGNSVASQTASETSAAMSSASTESTESTATVTTGPQPLGGTITSAVVTTATTSSTTGSSSASTTGGTDGDAAASTTRGPTTGGGNSGNTGFGGASSNTVGNTTGSSGGVCVGSAPAASAVALVPDDGWVACNTNTIGVQGEFFTYTDDGGSTITLSATGDDVCLEGTAGLMDASTWGAGVGFNVNQTESGEDPNQWDAEAMNISGFRFTLSALPVSGMRLVYQTDGIDYCVPLTSPGMQTVMFDETAEECWATGGGPPDPSTLESIKWQVTTDSAGEHDFDFCITGLAAIP